MVVVAIIAVLAIVVVPSFIKETKRAGAKSEVQPMFSELGTRLEQYKLEANAFLPMTACPPAANAKGTDITTAACATTSGNPWLLLRVQAPVTKLKCSYSITTGDGGVDPTAETSWPTWAPNPPGTPATSWYFIKAVCPDTEYMTASWDTTLRAQDGH